MNWNDLIPVLKGLPNLQQVTLELTGAKPDEIVRAMDFISSCWNNC
jgi:hypothetical protein